MTNADDDAISPNVTMPLAKAWPDEPRIVNAVMLVPKSDSRNTAGPERAAGEEVILGVARRRDRAEREDADVENDGEIGEDDERRESSRVADRRLEVRRPGDAVRTDISSSDEPRQ